MNSRNRKRRPRRREQTYEGNLFFIQGDERRPGLYAQEEHTHMRSQAWTLDAEYYYISLLNCTRLFNILGMTNGSVLAADPRRPGG